MAQVAGTFSTYDAAGNREDLIDNIYDVSREETPGLTAMRKVKARATNHEWQTDVLAAAAANAQIEGDEASYDAPAATTRLGNQTQILEKNVIISGTQEAVDSAGRNSDLAYQMSKRMKELKRDGEFAIFGVDNAKVAGNDTTAREMASLTTYLTSNTSAGVGGADATGDGTDTRTAGTARAITQALTEDVLQSMFTNSTDRELMMIVGAHVKGVVSTFTASSTRNVTTDDKKLVTSIDVIDGDFHTVKVVPDAFSLASAAFIINPEYLALAELRPMEAKVKAPTGDAEKRQITWECTLQVSNEAAHGLVADLSTS